MRTDAPIVLKIFGNERCVVMLDDLEAAAKAAPKAQSFLDGKTIKKVIVVPRKMVNLVVG